MSAPTRPRPFRTPPPRLPGRLRIPKQEAASVDQRMTESAAMNLHGPLPCWNVEHGEEDQARAEWIDQVVARLRGESR